MSENKQQLAEQAAQSMYGRDKASQHLGITVAEVRPGYARLEMPVVEWMLQGHDVCHGGLLFALADTAMAFASNAHNETHLAINANIDFLRPATLGETLVAEASEGNRTRKTGMYDVTITNESGKRICHFRGRTYGVGGSVIRDAAKDPDSNSSLDAGS